MRILVVPERLRNLAQTLRRSESEWQALSARLNSQYRSLDWEVRQQAALDDSLQQALRLSGDLAARAGELAAFLESAAARFEAADQQGVSLVNGLGQDTLALLSGVLGLPAWTGLRAAGLSAWERLSAALGASLPGVSPLPSSGGGAVAGVALLSSLPLLGSALRSLAECVWNWLRNNGWHTNAELASFPSYRYETPTDIPKGQLSRVILEGLQKQSSASAQASDSGQVVQTLRIDSPAPSSAPGQVVHTLKIDPPPQYDVYHPVPVRSQGTLYGNAACLPTSSSMVMDYYHAQNPAYPTALPQDLLNMLDPGDGIFSWGIIFDHLNDDLAELGYRVETHRGNLDDLRHALQDGPVVVNLKVDLPSFPVRDIRPGNQWDHAVVVKGLNADSVVINDPWSGAEKVFPRADFERMWSDGGRWMNLIRPR